MVEDMENAFEEQEGEHDEAGIRPEGFQRQLGGADPVESVRTPKKRLGLLIVLGIVLTILITLYLFVRSPKAEVAKDAPKTATVALAGLDTAQSAGIGVLDTTANLSGPVTIDSVALRAATARGDSIRQAASMPLPQGGATMPLGASTLGGGSTVLPQGAAEGTTMGMGPGGMGTGALVDSGSSGLAPGMASNAAAARENRIAEARARRMTADSVRKLRVAAEEGRLRGMKTAIIEGDAPTAGTGGMSRFTPSPFSPDGDAATGTTEAAGENGTAAPAAEASIGGTEIPPGTSVRAIMESKFVGDGNGDGSSMVKARLVQALVVNGKVLLPANTVAYGQASGSGGVGTQAYVKMAFTTFVTPRHQVFRNLQAVAGDPKTFSGAVSGDVDQHLTGRITRGILATAVDIALSANSQRLSAFQQPSTRDVAILKAQDRFSGIIEGNVGDESSKKPTITLNAGTAINILFGLAN